MGKNTETETVPSEAVTAVEFPDVKVAFKPLHKVLIALYPELESNDDYMKLVKAGKGGGGSGETSFVIIGGNKVGRICALTHAVFAHDNTDKDKSFFYKNGSYMIGAEIVKAQAKKEWDKEHALVLQSLEDQMLDGELSPKEWKEAVTEANKAEFNFTMDADTKAQLIADFDGYPSKEAFIEAYNAGAVPPFTDYADKIEALRKLGEEPEPVEETTTEA